MSRIYFHAEHDTVEVAGPERHLFGWLCGEMLLVSLEPLIDEYKPEESKILPYIPADSYVHSRPNKMTITLYLRGTSWDNQIVTEGHKYPLFRLALNTALVAGSDPIKLGARIHGSCEIHGFVRNEHCRWLAEIVAEGRKSGIFRPDMGWEEVAALLHSEPGTVVMSYSVCEQFPNRHVAEFSGGEDAWYDLSEEERWAAALNGLYKQDERSCLDLKPSNWNTFCFGDGMNGFRFAEHVWSKQPKEDLW